MMYGFAEKDKDKVKVLRRMAEVTLVDKFENIVLRKS